jgi:DNA-binding NarL/FixJ family response regulator
MQMPKIRLAIIDDHKIVRDGLKALLHNLKSFEVIAEAGDGEEALALVDNPDIDVFLMDIAMPTMNGLEATGKIIARRADAKVIILSMHATDDYVKRAMARGAKGYMIKNMAPDELEQAILKVVSGGTYLSPSISDTAGMHDRSDTSALLEVLSQRQLEILIALVDGRTTREIAATLSISVKTVETHRSQLMQKLNIFDVPGLVKFALRHGLINVD